MKINQIYTILDDIAPFMDCQPWDNSGILINPNQKAKQEIEFENIILALDVDFDLARKATKNSLFIVHHPLIFKGLKSLDCASYPSNIISELLQKNCALIAMHTNFDKHILNDYVLKEVLNINEYEKNEFICTFRINQNFDEFADFVKKRLEIEHLRVVKSSDFIKKVAFCTGSGADLINTFKADCFLTGDLKYHTAFECYENGLSLIDIEHFASEKYFNIALEKALKKHNIFATIANSLNPFTYK